MGLHKTVLITEQDDLRTAKGQNKALSGLRGPGDILWHSQPCTGGCPWQKINAKKFKSAKAKLETHYRLFRELWNAFEVVAETAIARGASVWIEWPKKCFYWNTYRVRRFLQKHDFDDAYIDGCMHGLVAPSGPNTGMKM